jgi:putative flippase GtrA
MMLALSRVVSFYLSAQFARFILVGGVALACHWLSRFVFNEFVDYGWAISLAYLVGILVAFVLNKIYVFPYSERSLKFEVSAFLLVNIAAFPVVWAVAYVLGEWILTVYMPRSLALALAHGFAITLPVFVNYALHKLVTFRGA